MKIGIYNKYLHTYGGGEKHSTAIAELLSRNNEVDLITHRNVSKNLLETRLNVDLRNVNIHFLPEDYDDYQVSKITHEYDFFINSTYLSTLPSLAKKSLLLVFFPSKFNLKNRLCKHLDRLNCRDIEYLSGFYQVEVHNNITYRWTTNCAELRFFIGCKKKPAYLIIPLGGFRPDKAKDADVSVFMNEKKISTLTLPKERFHKYKFEIPVEFGGLSYIYIKITTETFNPSELGISDDTRDIGVAVGGISLSGINIVDKLFRYSRSLYRSLTHVPYDHLKTYNVICANSEYTRNWIRKYWSIDSVVLYPPIDTEFFKPLEKKNYIVSVGRFFEGSHNKKHIPMIQAFKSMCDEGLNDWQYHLVGGTHKEELHQRYLKKVKEECVGYPIFIHTDISFEELQRFYGQAKIFWHAAGFGEDGKNNPDKFEHFGITTVEAISAGCIPIVVGMAGQLEIIDNGSNGFLWNNLNELKEKTRKVIEDEELQDKIRKNALKTCERFNKINFEKKLMSILNSHKIL